MAMGLGFLGRERRRGIAVGVVHLVGSAAGGAAVGALLAALGAALGLPQWRTAIVAGAALVVLATGLAMRHFELGRPCQVPRKWSRSMPAYRRFLVWGAMLGAGVVTLIPYPAYLLLLAAQATAPVTSAVVAGALFGVAREAPALAGLLRPAHPEDAMEVLPRLSRPWRLLNLGVTVMGGGGLLLSTL